MALIGKVSQPTVFTREQLKTAMEKTREDGRRAVIREVLETYRHQEIPVDLLTSRQVNSIKEALDGDGPIRAA